MKRVEIFSKYIQKIQNVIDFYNSKFRSEYTSFENKIGEENYKILINSDENNILLVIQQIAIQMLNEANENMYQYNTSQKQNMKFIMVSLTDELIIKNLIEIHVEVWNKLLLEKYFFGTSIAGEKIINNINDHNQYHSNHNNPLSIINYYVIMMGFLGIYKNNSNEIKKLKITTFKTLRNDYNVTLEENLCNSSYNIIKGPDEYNRINYKSIYINILLLIVISELFYIFYIIQKYFTL